MEIKLFVRLSIIFGILIVFGVPSAFAEVKILERVPTTIEKHNWKQSSVHYDVVEVGEHEYTYWKNFIRQSRTCQISHRIKTIVYYCEEHNHTKVETVVDEVIHSNKHGEH
ncbi:hypothetical protein [Ornithinibacillus scapharcae]|uniref:hypothetical protein n=1 Tax=Ornithinibacillus scapharcae TaxID=1147159 RepID=UPI000225AD74|nr:hypothetical protein [Ornithinibacillus scapharcae]